MMKFLKDFFGMTVTAMTPQDGVSYGVAGAILLIGKFCTGLIPLVALLIAIGQLRIQYVRYQREKLRLRILEAEKDNKQEEHALKMSGSSDD